jgi:outer membrane receptor for ferrienterochelin and colicin
MQRNMIRCLLVLIALPWIAAFAAAAADQPPEMLLFEQIPTVVTAARKEQLATQAPMSMTVITREEIRASGAIAIPDVLRMVPGLDVMQPTATDWEVNARGLNQGMSNKMLVMVDGRVVYRYLYGNTVWETLPVVLEDIERIEIVRGPGSSLYGANAFSGVINIITRSVQSAAGTMITGGWGDYHTGRWAAITANAGARVPYKLSLGSEQTHSWLSPTERSGFDGKVNLLLEPRLRGRAALNIWVGGSEGRAEIRLNDTTRDPLIWSDRTRYLNVLYQSEQTNLRLSWNHDVADVVHSELASADHAVNNVWDFEAQNTASAGRHNSLLYGGSFRHNTLSGRFLDRPERRQITWSLYAQDEWRARPGMTVVGGARLDNDELLGTEASPHLSVLQDLGRNQTLRFSAGRAYRSPTFLEAYALVRSPVAPGADFVLHGNEDLLPERMTDFELEYRARPLRSLHLAAEVFRYDADHLILPVVIAYFPSPPFPPGINSDSEFFNVYDARATGVTASAEFLLARNLSGFGNYTYQDLWRADTGEPLRQSPRNKYNVGLRYSAPSRLSGSLTWDHVGATVWDGGRVPAYDLLNGRLAYVFPEHDVELALSIFNLGKLRHIEFARAEQLDRRIVVCATHHF